MNAYLSALCQLRRHFDSFDRPIVELSDDATLQLPAIYLATPFGADVTGVCSARNVDTVRSIGADRVVDYTREDFTKDGNTGH